MMLVSHKQVFHQLLCANHIQVGVKVITRILRLGIAVVSLKFILELHICQCISWPGMEKWVD